MQNTAMTAVETWFFGPGDVAGEPVVVCRAPRIVYVPRFLDGEDCAHLIALGRPGLRRGAVYDRTFTARLTGNRTGEAAGVERSKRDRRLQRIERKVAALGGLGLAHAEALQVLRYREGQRFGPHLDAARFRDGGRRSRLLDREVSVLVALNEGWSGGATRFPAIGLEISPRRGDAFLFRSLDRRGRIDPRVLHEGRPVARGTKWMLVSFLRRSRRPPGARVRT